MKKRILCSINIATYKRPDFLRQLIKSLLKQKGIENINLEIIVVDNDVNQSAISIVSEFSNQSNVSISYYNQPEQNISLTRNMGLDNASGKYIAIIDDDETADSYWIINLLNTANKL